MKYISRGALCAIIATLSANPAASLSCAKPNVARTFNWAAESKDVYMVGYGALRAIGDVKDPNTYPENQLKRKSYSIDANFTGTFLSKRGFVNEQTIPVTVTVQCLSVWCGQFPVTKENVLVFIQKTKTGFEVTADPCGSNIMTAPSIKQRRTLTPNSKLNQLIADRGYLETFHIYFHRFGCWARVGAWQCNRDHQRTHGRNGGY